jgi:hypothetical protein
MYGVDCVYATSEDGCKWLRNVMEGGRGLFVALSQKYLQGLKPAIHLVTGPDDKVGPLNKNMHCQPQHEDDSESLFIDFSVS